MRDKTKGHILADWRDEHVGKFGNESLKLLHNLHTSELFQDEALADLLQRAPRDSYHVNTMDRKAHNPASRREGDKGNLSGEELMRAVRSGNLWINIQRPDAINPAYGDLLKDIYGEFEARVPGLKTYKHMMTVLISSPNLKVKYHFDIPGQTLWQVRGRKKVYVYRAEAPFLPLDSLEKVTINEAHETDLAYEEAFDNEAEIFDLEPGQMLHWPLNRPHRVVNEDCLNVSVTTEHWTDQLRNIYLTNFGNAMLRKAGFKSLSSKPSGVGFYPKAAIAAATKISGMQRRKSKPYHIDFVVDPDMPDSVRDIEPYEFRK